MTTKTCLTCGQTQDTQNFSKNSRNADGLHHHCRRCHRAATVKRLEARKAAYVPPADGCKVCSKCKERKPLEDFCVVKALPDGRNHYCKACAVERSKVYFQEHKEARLAYNAAYKKTHRERINEQASKVRSAHLTEALLGEFLMERANMPFTKVRLLIEGSVILPDYCNEAHKVIVEFDGYQHYSDPEIVLRDRVKDRVLHWHGYRVIRVPYFVQLDATVISLLFDGVVENKEGWNTYPHGFVNGKALLPTAFCPLGLQRYKSEVKGVFSSIEEDILNSLRERSRDMEEKKRGADGIVDRELSRLARLLFFP